MSQVMPVLSMSFFLVVMSLMVTGHKLQGPPLCFNTCRVCLSHWDAAIGVTVAQEAAVAAGQMVPGLACGHSNGRELLTYYTMSQTSFILFFTVIVTMVRIFTFVLLNAYMHTLMCTQACELDIYRENI